MRYLPSPACSFSIAHPNNQKRKIMSDWLLVHLEKQARHFKNIKLLFRFFFLKNLTKTPFIDFQCNICGYDVSAPMAVAKNREASSCYRCGSNRRFRTIIAILTKEITGETTTLPKLNYDGKITGLGMSDAEIYARPLSKKVTYTNTFYHKEPKLDITTIKQSQFNSADFIITSDVFEHIPPPIEHSFENLYKILKKGGLCIFSVPYHKNGTTQEHFPELYDYKIIKKNGRQILVNITKKGERQEFNNLRFHGGPGATLEMRFFTETSLLANLQDAGFSNIQFHRTNIPEFGIIVEEESPSLIISMHKE